MIRHPTLVVIVCGLVLCVKCPILHADAVGGVEQVVLGVFQPAIKSFRNDTDILLRSVKQDCRSHATKAAYRSASRSFSKIEIVQIGQLLKENRLERLFFWPDRKSIGQRQVRQLLSNPDLGSLSLSELEGKSVALQGFPALGRVLFRQEPPTDAACHYAAIVAANLNRMANTLFDDWHSDSGVGSRLINPRADYRYRNHQETVGAVLRMADAGLKSFRERKLNRIIKGVKKKNALLKSSPFYQGALTFDHLRQNLNMIASIALDPSFTALPRTTDKIQSEFQRAHQMLNEAQKALSENKSSRAFQRLVALRFIIDIIHDMIRNDVLKKHNVSIGFNSSDGD